MVKVSKDEKVRLLEPRATEKTYGEQTKRIYVFPVKKSMGKQAIAKQVEQEFGVTVTEVKTLVRKGRAVRFSRGKRAYPGTTHRQDQKFAYVRLAEGDSIRVFEEADNEAAEKAVKQEKEAKGEKEVKEEKETKKEKEAKKEIKEEKTTTKEEKKTIKEEGKKTKEEKKEGAKKAKAAAESETTEENEEEKSADETDKNAEEEK